MDVRELESKIHNLERKIDDLGYDLRQARGELEAKISHKADEGHSHEFLVSKEE